MTQATKRRDIALDPLGVVRAAFAHERQESFEHGAERTCAPVRSVGGVEALGSFGGPPNTGERPRLHAVQRRSVGRVPGAVNLVSGERSACGGASELHFDYRYLAIQAR